MTAENTSDAAPLDRLDLARIANLEAEARQFDAEVRRSEAESENQRQLARKARLEADEAEREGRKLRNSLEQHRIWYLTDSVGSSSSRVAVERLHQWHAEDLTCDMELWLTSPGGSAIYGMALFDYIMHLRSKGHHITTVALGVAASMAAILLQAGDRRVMGREAWLLVHEVSWGAEGKVGELEDATKWMEKMCERVARIFVERSNGKISMSTFKKSWARTDWWLDSTEALRLGLVDEVI